MAPHHKPELAALVQVHTAHALSINASIDLSEADTASKDSDSSLQGEVEVLSDTDSVAVKHPGSPEVFSESMQKFISDFLSMRHDLHEDTADVDAINAADTVLRFKCNVPKYLFHRHIQVVRCPLNSHAMHP